MTDAGGVHRTVSDTLYYVRTLRRVLYRYRWSTVAITTV